MSAGRPSFDEAIKAIDGFGLRQDNPGAVELADALVLTQELHRPSQADADASGHYGACDACGVSWPCPTWGVAHRAAVEWLCDASGAVLARYGKVAPPLGDPVKALERVALERVSAA